MTLRAAVRLSSAALTFALAMGALVDATPRSVDSHAAPSPSGEAIYLKGVLGSGELLLASRADTEPLTGEQAACVSCHRQSGLGGTEARNVIPPITGQFLFDPRAARLDEVQLPYIPGARPDRTPYTEATLARAIREGVSSEGRDLSYLMPRYALSDADMAALINHLRTLDHRHVPGVSSMELHFATIIAPDADPVARRGMLAVLQQFFEDRNIAPRGLPALNMAPSGNTAYAKGMFKVNRRWVLHVWEPTGPPETWTEQLEKDFAAQPVFAVISGLAGRNWAPVSTFCERRAVPCLFPNVAQPPADADHNFHTLYFSRGVLLEADLIGAGLLDTSAGKVTKRVRQVYRAGDVGETGAHALTAVLSAKGVIVASRAIPHGAPPSALAEALRDVSSTDALVLWLRQPDLTALKDRSAPPIPLDAIRAGTGREKWLLGQRLDSPMRGGGHSWGPTNRFLGFKRV